MTKNFIIPVIIIYLILANILSLTLVLVRNRRQYEKSGKSHSSVLLITLSVLGGGFGVLFGLMIRDKETKAPVFMAVASLTLLWILLPAAVVLLEPVSGDSSLPLQTRARELSPGSSESVLVASTEFSDPSAAVIEGIGSISRSESTRAAQEEYEAALAAEEAAREAAAAAQAQAAAEAAARAAAETDGTGSNADTQQHHEDGPLTEEYASFEEASQLVEPTLTETEAPTETEPETPAEIVPSYVSIAAIGDMLMHPGVSGYAFQPDGSLNYDFCFDPIREELVSADIAVVNNEVPFGGNEFGLKNYPNFNVYQELGDAEVRAGFDVILNSTNHVRDMGTDGIFRTINFWKNYPDVYSIGIHENEEDRERIRVIERNGVRIALLNYCYGINAGFPYDQPYLIDMMREEDREKIAWDLQRAEELADFTIVFPHWGEEYQLKESPDQDRWAEFFTEHGADLIIGTHPHVLEPIRWVTAWNGNRALCYYSLGNYISLQDETMSVLGGMARVVLLKDSEGVRIVNHNIQYLVTQYEADVSWAYVYKLENYTEDLAARHGIRTANLPGNGLNQYYPFGIDTFHRIIGEVQQNSDPME